MNIAKIRRAFNHFYTKWQTILHEKQYSAYGTRVKYMFFEESTSNVLLVSFPAFDPNTAKYNYMRTLLPYKCNKIFLLDDYGENHRGCYLVKDAVEMCVKELLTAKIELCKKTIWGQPPKVIFLGSSKGGYCALNFSFLIPDVTVVIGSPQYYIGSYLDRQGTIDNLRFLVGEITEEKKDKLNSRLRDRIQTSEIVPTQVYFHYSNAEHIYQDHVKDMLRDLKERGIPIIEDIHSYEKHSELKDFYPPFLVKSVNKIIEQ